MSTVGRGSRWRLAVQKLLEASGAAVMVRGIGFAGDDLRWPGWSGECKDVGRIDLAGFIDQAVANADGRIPVVFVKRRGRGPGQGYAVMTIDDFLRAAVRPNSPPHQAT